MADDPYPTEPCRSCDKPVIWATTTNAKSMPVDPEPAKDGNVALMWSAGRVLADVLNVQRQATRTSGSLHKSHFATCPHAARWRTGRRRR